MPTALITGASNGIGKSFAEKLAARNTNLIIVARSEDKLNTLAKQLQEQHKIQVNVIVNVSSIAAFQPIPYLSVYAASKAFVSSFSEALWAENRQYGVRVLAVCPGPTETNFFVAANFPPALARNAKSISTPEEVVTRALKALDEGQANVVVGGIASHFITKLSSIVPRETLLNLLEKQFKA